MLERKMLRKHLPGCGVLHGKCWGRVAFHISDRSHSSSLTEQGVVLGEPPRGACSRRQEGHTTRKAVSIHQGKPVIKVLSKHKSLYDDTGQLSGPNRLPLHPWSSAHTLPCSGFIHMWWQRKQFGFLFICLPSCCTSNGSRDYCPWIHPRDAHQKQHGIAADPRSICGMRLFSALPLCSLWSSHQAGKGMAHACQRSGVLPCANKQSIGPTD